MTMIEGAIRDVGIGGLAVCAAGGIPGAAMYLSVRALRGAANELAKEHDPLKTIESKQQDNGNNVDTTA